MLQKIKAGLLMSMIAVGSLSAESDDDKIYIDSDEMREEDDSFHIHLGENEWIETNTVHRNATGLFTYQCNVVQSSNAEYEKKWRCPYCYKYWPMGASCKNPNCPSKFTNYR